MKGEIMAARLLLGISLTAFMSAPCLAQPSDRFNLSGEIFSNYRYTDSQSQRFSSFDLERAEIGFQSPASSTWGGELRIESVRSAGENSLQGIDGDSLVFRLKRAWGYGSIKEKNWSLHTQFGLIPDPWHLVVMNLFPLRALGPSQGEREGLQDTSDLGFSLNFELYQHKLFMSLTNGEGRRYLEQNKGKNLLLGAQFQLLLSTGRLWVTSAYRDGSTGPSSGRDHRLYFASEWRSKRVSLGLIGSRAWGLKNRSALSAMAIQTWGAAWLIPRWLGVYLNGEYIEYQREAPLSTLSSSITNLEEINLSSSAIEWGVGFSHQLYISQSINESSASRDGNQHDESDQIRLTLFETLRYRGASDLKSPIYGVPQLASEWSATVIVQLTWGPPALLSSSNSSASFF